MKKALKISIVFILITILIICYIKSRSYYYLENIIIFNLYENSDNKFVFNVSSGINQNKNINLYSTFKVDGLMNTKIFPGTKGEFEILIKSSNNVEYQIKFKSKNKKPQNLLFNIKNSNIKYNNLEDLGKNLKGLIKPKDNVRIIIQWSWEYETSINNNHQDTLDGETLKEYNFYINILSNKI